MNLLKAAVIFPIFWNPLYFVTLMKLAHLGALGYALINIYLCPPQVAAAIVNRTIDDQFGDSVTGLRPTYSPTHGVWDTQNGTCSANNCFINPDVTQAFRKTYTAGTYYPTMGSMGISMQFNGTAIYVFFILANYLKDDVTTFTSANFTVDDEAPVLFTWDTSALSPNFFQYNASVFSQTNLSNTLHTLKIATTGSASVYVNFDYAIYTYDNTVSSTSSLPVSTMTSTQVSTTLSLPASAVTSTQEPPTTTSHKPSPSGAALHSTTAIGKKTLIEAIVGGVLGGIAVLVFVIFLLFRRHRRGGRNTLQGNGDMPLPTGFGEDHDTFFGNVNGKANPSAALALGRLYTQPSVYSTNSSTTTDTAVRLANETADCNSSDSVKGGGPLKRPLSALPNGAQEPHVVLWDDHAMSYGDVTSGPFDPDYQPNTSNVHKTPSARQVVICPPSPAHQPPRPVVALASSVSSSSQPDAGEDRRSSSQALTPPNIGATQKLIHRTRQEEIDYQLRMAELQNALQLQESSLAPRRPSSLKGRTLEGAELIGGGDMWAPEAIWSFQEQIRILREQLHEFSRPSSTIFVFEDALAESEG